MVNINHLPDELQDRIISFLDRRSLAQIRLVNKRLERMSIGKLFERVSLYAHWKRLGYDEMIEYGLYGVDGDTDGHDEEEVGSVGYKYDETNRATDTLKNDEMQVDKSDQLSESSDIVSNDIPTMTPIERQNYINEWQEKRLPPIWAVDKLPGPSGYDARAFRNIVQNDKLRQYVREVQIYTCDTHCDHHPAYASRWHEGFWPFPNFDPVYHECIRRLGEFEHIRKLIIHFDRHGGDYDYDDILQRESFQKHWFQRILHTINGRPNELAIRHYENFEKSESESPIFIDNVANLTSLRMSIKHGETQGEAGPTYRCGDIHPFWERFPNQFLEPPSEKLTSLVLYSDLPLGWFPKLDLRTVHFPRLRSLTLGQHIFHNNHQIDWIISHQSTLKELYLDHCSILYQIGHSIPGWLDGEGYPVPMPPGSQTPDYGWSLDPIMSASAESVINDMCFKSYSMRWHHVLDRFSEDLHRLGVFRLGSSTQWKFDVESRYVEDGAGSDAHPIMPWEDEQNIQNRILWERYVIWDDWDQQYRPQWHTRFKEEAWKPEWKTKFETFPYCDEDDEAALRTLLRTVKGRSS